MLRSLINQRLGRYLITAQLGRGGMAAVYRATDTMLQRDVALKVLYAQYADDASLVERFKREAVTAAALEHPNIVPIYDVGEQDGMVYIAMKLLTGRSLADVLGERGTLSLAEVLLVLEPVAAALDYAHSKGVIHRDIKPGNILLDGDTTAGQPLSSATRVMLTDFGIAKTLDRPGMTTTGALIGTPDYMAPEQIGNQNVDRRVDVYALGMVAFRALTGRQAFEGTTQDVLVGHLYGTVPAPSSLNTSLGQTIDSAIMRALARDPNGRLASAGALVAALKQPASSDMPTQVGSPPVRPQPAPARPATNSGTAPPVSRPATAAPRTQTTTRQRVAAPPSPAPAARPEPQGASWLPWLLVFVLLVALGGLGLRALGVFSADTPPPLPTAVVINPTDGATAPPALTDTASPTATITATAEVTPTAEVTATATAEVAPTAVPTTPPQPTPPPVQPTPPPRPTNTPLPPTAVPTNTPAPTATPTAAPIACDPPIQLERGFKNIYENFAAVRTKLGCPRTVEVPTNGAIQIFERGTMIWYEANDFHYVLFGDERGTYRVFDRTEVNALPIPTPQPPDSPTDPLAPGGGFAQIYYNLPEIREKLGKPIVASRGLPLDQGDNGSYQFFAGGAMLFSPFYINNNRNKTIFVVYNTDNTFERYRDTTP